MSTREIPFVKMDGLGNDFVIVDERTTDYGLSAAEMVAIANRKTGVGFDQMIIIKKPDDVDSHYAKMLIFNADGSSAGACGNGTRCVGKLLLAESGKESLKIEAPAGRALSAALAGKLISANMGKPALEWRDIPLASECDTLCLPQIISTLPAPVAVSVGNPHAVYFVNDVAAVDIAKYGDFTEHNPLFPERTNVEFAEIKSPSHIRMRVWERGAGITMACGTGACATLVAAVRKGLSERTAKIEMDGGELTITWAENGDILMTGSAHKSFEGVLFL